MGNSWKDLFTFSRKEQGGIAVLLFLILLLIILYPLIPVLTPHRNFDTDEFVKAARSFMDEQRRQDSLRDIEYPIHKDEEKVDQDRLSEFLDRPFSFDPNTITAKELEATGLDPFIARNICKYREKGGRFKKPGDLARIYGMNDRWLMSVKPYLIIGEDKKEAQNTETGYGDTAMMSGNDSEPLPLETTHAEEDFIVELNSADSSALVRCPGIGPVFAARILAYRNLLGGFYKKEQLLEVFGMDSSRYVGLKDKLKTDPHLIDRMDINRVAFKEMLRHPYFEYYMVKSIFSYKDARKQIDSIGEIRSLPEIYPELYEKISPYLEVKK